MLRPFHKKMILVFGDFVLSVASLYIAFMLSSSPLDLFVFSLTLLFPVRFVFFIRFGLYNFMWRYASTMALLHIVSAVTLGSLVFFLVTSFFASITIPLSTLSIEWAFNLIFVGGYRFALRVYRDYKRMESVKKTAETAGNPRIFIVGAGDGGVWIARDLQYASDVQYQIIGFIDDSKEKQQKKILDFPVLGPVKDLVTLAEKHDVHQVIIAMPSASGTVIREIVGLCEQASISCKITPSLFEILEGKSSVTQLREVRIEDLLGRKVVENEIQLDASYIKDKVVLITGGGGSIGSEICRQIAQFKPKKLIMLDHSEYAAYEIDMEIRDQFPECRLETIVANVKDFSRLKRVFEKFHPEVVFHAAAYKHVPLMEENVSEVVHNNIFGTKNLLELSVSFDVDRFVLISTDKAVNPTNVMGASKRICEMMMLTKAKSSRTVFSAVRFGNVLGSNGSVVPLFRKQIQNGGPVTITHPDMTRYFMTIPEAVRLVIQAGALAQGGEVFVLDMGDPVKIVQLAKDMIHLSGLVEGKDIELKFTGLRPGEKLFEELFLDREYMDTTSHRRIFVAKSGDLSQSVNLGERLDNLQRLIDAAASNSILRDHLMILIQETTSTTV